MKKLKKKNNIEDRYALVAATFHVYKCYKYAKTEYEKQEQNQTN